MNPGIPLKETTSWRIYKGHSISHSLLSTSKISFYLLVQPNSNTMASHGFRPNFIYQLEKEKKTRYLELGALYT